jgi:4-hydroxy-3-polyprenylbenzoate decarboxylase
MVGAQGYPRNISEYDFAGGLLGQPIEIVKGEVTDLPIPAQAEIVVEGIAYPGNNREEGPFGEFTGYYGRPGEVTPVIDIKCVHHRNQPILTSALMADYPSCEQNYFISIVKSAKIWDDLESMGIPGIKGVYSHPAAAGGFGMVVVSMEQRFAGHAAQVLALTAQCPGAAYYTKWIVAVEEDVDPTNMDEVIWAMSTRCNPVEDIDILRNTWSTYLDPTQNPPEIRPYGSKALINACREHKYLNVFSVRSRVTRGMYDNLSAKWSELGLDGEPPVIRSFETEKLD